jgi:S-DNA-T family DNA segregation ATPase FtsK/SpoIIIE
MASYQARQRDPLLDQNMAAMLERRGRELLGLALIGAALAFAAMLWTYTPEDPGWMVATDEPAANALGRLGAAVASTLIIIGGMGAWGLPLVLAAWGLRFVLHRGAERALGRVVFAVIGVALASVYAATLVPGDSWAHSFGLGGLFGDTVLGALLNMIPLGAGVGLKLLSLVMGLACLTMGLFVTGFDLEELRAVGRFLYVGLVVTYSTLIGMARRAPPAPPPPCRTAAAPRCRPAHRNPWRAMPPPRLAPAAAAAPPNSPPPSAARPPGAAPPPCAPTRAIPTPWPRPRITPRRRKS